MKLWTFETNKSHSNMSRYFKLEFCFYIIKILLYVGMVRNTVIPVQTVLYCAKKPLYEYVSTVANLP